MTSSRRWRAAGELSHRSPFNLSLTSPTSPDAQGAFEELFLFACPKFITANSPPYDDPEALAAYVASTESSEPLQADPTRRHLSLFLADAAAQGTVPTLRSFLKLYTSVGAPKLANFLDADEEEMVQELMVMKQSSRSTSRVGGGSLLDGETISTSDLNFVVDEVRREGFGMWPRC